VNPPPERQPSARYLGDPNYYRLAYQLAAQYANWLLSLPLATKRGPESGDLLRSATEAAKRTAEDARRMLRWYEYKRSQRRWWQRKPKPLPAREERLQRFLAGTVEPSAELLLAGMLLFSEGDEAAEQRAAPVREAADRGELTYRALYNLACYEAQRSGHALYDDDSLRLALEHLRQALRCARGRSRVELVRWARADPSLAPLREHQLYGRLLTELLARFEPTDTAANRTQDRPGNKRKFWKFWRRS
jgi:hypothetical protein